MLKEIVLPPIDMKNFSSQPIDSNLIIMSHDFNVNELVIPFYETNVFDTYEAFYSFQGNTSIIIQEVFKQNNEIRIPIVNDVRRHKGIFTIELNASSNSTQATLLKLNVMVKRSNIDSNSEFLFNHYYKLFEDYEKEIAELNNATQSTIKTQLKQSQDNLQKVTKTLIAINDKVMVVNDTADGFMLDVATKQADVTSKYNAFDTSVTQANQTIDEILSLQPQFQAVLDETTGKDVISAPEIILARNGEADLKARLDKDQQQVTTQLAEVTTQLAQKADYEDLQSTNSTIDGTNKRIDALIIESGDTNAEVTDAHVSIIKNKTFETLGNRLNESERDFDEYSSRSPFVNDVENGDFRNGITKWLFSRASGVVENNEIKVTGRDIDFAATLYQVVNTIPGHRYYISALVKSDSDKVCLALHSSGKTFHTGSGNYERLSNIYNVVSTTRNIQVTDDSLGEQKAPYYVRNVLMIDLTEVFGAGNEPSKAKMDEILTNFKDSWFNGGASLDGAFKFTNKKINDVDNRLSNDIEAVANKVELIKPTHLVKSGGKNKFDKTKALPFTTIEKTGTTRESPYDWRTSDYIPVESNQKIAINKARFVAEYDRNKVFIKGTHQDISPEGSSVFTTSSNTQFIRVTTLSDNVDNLQVEMNSAPTEYEEHYYSIFIDDEKVYDLKEGGDSLMVDTDLLTLKNDYTKFVDRKNYQIWQAKDWNSKKIKAIYKDVAVRVKNYSIGKYTIEISTTGINGSYGNVIEFNDTNFPNLIANSNIEYIMLLPWTRNFTSGQGAKDWRMVIMTNRGQMYHNFPSRATNGDGSEVAGDMTRFDESVIWDLPERKFPSKDINATGVERYYPVLPDKSYQYHPPINTDNGYGNGGFDKSVTKGSVTYPRFYFPNRESVNNSLTPMGGYEPDDKITLLGTYRSNVKEGEAVRICLFATDDGGRSWYTKYEFGSEGKLAPNFTNSINTSSLASSYTTNSFSLSKRDNVLPTSENKEPSTKFSWSTNVPITDITRAQKSVVTTATPHGLSSGNVIAIKRNQSGSADWAFLLNDNVSETSGGNGLLYRVKVLTSTTFELYEFVHSAHNNLPARHIHFINRIKDGWLFGTGETYPQGWVMYMQMKAADTFYPKRAHEDFLIVRLTSSNGAVERLLGATMFDNPDSTMLVAMDNETTPREDVLMPPGRTESFSRSSTGIFKGKLSDIDDMSKFYPVYEAKQVSYFFKEKGGAFIWGGQRGEFAISLDKGETWLTENLDGVIWHFYGESKKVIAIDDFIIFLKQ